MRAGHAGRVESAERFRARRGFTVIELLLGLGLLSISGSYLFVELQRARDDARQVICISNCRQLAIAQNSYAIDFRDRIGTFNWSDRLGGKSGFGDLQDSLGEATTDSQYAAIQAVDILRRRSGIAGLRLPNRWLPHPQYTNLVIQDYLASRLPEPMLVCPEDAVRASWQEHVATFPRGPELVPDDANDRNALLPYSSSYQYVAAAYDDLQNHDLPEERWLHRIRQGSRHDRYLMHKESRLGGVSFAQVAFPSNKVLIYDSHDRHSEAGTDGPLYYADLRASQPVTFFDGSVQMRRTSEANGGWDPHRPDNLGPTIVTYSPQLWERAGGPQGVSLGFWGSYRWTRNGVKGIDFGGPEQGVDAMAPLAAGVTEVSH